MTSAMDVAATRGHKKGYLFEDILASTSTPHYLATISVAVMKLCMFIFICVCIYLQTHHMVVIQHHSPVFLSKLQQGV